jgi:hypothetical protein
MIDEADINHIYSAFRSIPYNCPLTGASKVNRPRY